MRAHADELQALKTAYQVKENGAARTAPDPETLAQSLKTVASVCADQMIDERELFALLEAESALRQALQFRNYIGLLGEPQRDNLEKEVFEPIETILVEVHQHERVLTETIVARDQPALEDRLHEPPRAAKVDGLALQNASQLADVTRYADGDLIRVARSQGGFSLGVVVGRDAFGNLRVEVESVNKKLGLRILTPQEVLAANPLRLGDEIHLGTEVIRVVGLDEKGELQIVDAAAGSIDLATALKRIHAVVEQQRFSEMPTPIEIQPPVPPAERAEPAPRMGTMPVIPVSRIPWSPIEDLEKPGPAEGLFARNSEARDPFVLTTAIATAALYTSKGYGYKDWNEDAGILHADRGGRIYCGVFDQAGGMGAVEEQPGEGSAIAAETFLRHMQQIARGNADPKGAADEMKAAALEAHRTLLARCAGEVTTFIGAMVHDDGAVLVNTGDSGAYHFSGTGQLVDRTQLHSLPPPLPANIVTEAVGQVGEEPKADAYNWILKHEDYLVIASDGLFDSGLSPEQVGEIVARAGGAEAACRALSVETISRMTDRRGKPDNLTILVLQRV